MRRAFPHLLLAAVFFIALAVGLGQYRRVTNDIPHDIDRMRAAFAPLQRLRMHDLRFVKPSGYEEWLQQARLVMAPTILHPADEPRTDTTLFAVLHADSAQIPRRNVLWRARDDAYFYALVVP